MTGLLYISFNAFSVAVLLMILHQIYKGVDKSTSQIMLAWFIVSSIILCSSDIIWGIFEFFVGWETRPTLSFLVNGIYHIFTCVVSYLWFLYSESEQNSKVVNTKIGLALSMIPLLIMVGLVAGSNMYDWVFYIDDKGEYHRGAQYVSLIFICFFYIFTTSIKAMIKSFKKENFLSKHHLRSLANFAFFPCVAGVLQVLFVGSPMISAGIAIAVLRVYISSREQLISVDPMTQLSNKKQMEYHLYGKMKSKPDNKDLYVFIMDLDYFKQINDKYGHIEGDEAIIIAANTIRQAVSKTDYFACRYGGDEFVVVCETSQDFKPKDFLEEVNALLSENARKAGKEYTMKFSVGYKKYSPEYTDVSSFIAAADEGLYMIKNSRPKIKDII